MCVVGNSLDVCCCPTPPPSFKSQQDKNNNNTGYRQTRDYFYWIEGEKVALARIHGDCILENKFLMCQ